MSLKVFWMKSSKSQSTEEIDQNWEYIGKESGKVRLCESPKRAASGQVNILCERLYDEIVICILLHHLVGGTGIYQLIKCGASGHNVRSKPNMRATPIGMLVLYNQIDVTEEVRKNTS